MDADLLHGFYLGDLFVEPLKGQVTDRTGSRRLPPKAAEVLLCLAREPGELVTREHLLECAWAGDKGSHEALSHAVSEIRTALDDHADDPVYIQTLPRVGYRLAIDPELPGGESDSIVIGAPGTSVGDIGLFENLRRRGVLETALAYMILGWLLIQVADVVFEQLHMPRWAGTFVTVLIIAGFPIAIALSWFLELRHGRAVLDDLSPADHRKRRFSRTYISIVCSLAIAGVMVAIYDQLVGLPAPEAEMTIDVVQEPQPPPIVENSLAVLPFANLDGSRETQVFADGLVEGVINQLSRIPGLRVASRGDSFTLEPNTPSQYVRDRLRVEMYLEGSVEMNADEMRVTVQLINSDDGFHILSRRFELPRQEFFALYDEITNLTVANVRISLPPELQPSHSEPLARPSLNAYALYRQGIEASRQPASIDTVASALGWFDAALSIDPDYAAAHAGKCAVYVLGYREMDDASYIERAESSCAKALSLNPNLYIVHTSLGDLYRATGRYNDAEDAYLTTLASDPTNIDALRGLGIAYQHLNQPLEAEGILRRATDAHPGAAAAFNSLGIFLSQQGRYDEALTQTEYAVALRPDNAKYVSNLGAAHMMLGDFASAARYYQRSVDIRPRKSTYVNLGMMYFYTGDYQAAIEAQRAAVELQPNDCLARANLADTLWAAGLTETARQAYLEAETAAERALEVNPNDPLTIMDMAWIKAGLHDHDEAREFIDRAMQIVPDDPYVHYYDGIIHNRAGNSSQAFVALQDAVQLGFPTAIIAGDPNLANLRGDSRFSDIAEESE